MPGATDAPCRSAEPELTQYGLLTWEFDVTSLFGPGS
jgi:hypothetical protein